MTLYPIWSEGYAATGERGGATYHGETPGETFEKACQLKFKFDKSYDKERNTLWGCRLFENEQEARASFG